jgi:hypothetical protein
MQVFRASPDEIRGYCAKGWSRSIEVLLSSPAVVGSSWKGPVVVARGSARIPTCEECFFARNMLCALAEPEACATFRPDHPDGLRPPQQLHFVFRTERRERSGRAFPSAQEQAALYA